MRALKLKTRPALFAFGAVLLSIMVYWPATANDFVYFDDDAYVTENPEVNAGLSMAGIRWAFTAVLNSNWHPLTWLSHMVDVSLFGLDPWGHHLMSVLIHAVNAGLLVLLLWRWTGGLWPALLAATLWALHPLRVESVAWVAERKDVLSLFFGLSCLLAYDAYVRRGNMARAALAWSALGLGLMAKPMLVTLPCVLLLLDLTLYRRMPWGNWRAAGWVLLEKLPFIALSLGSVLITLLAQRSAMQSPEALPWAVRGYLATQACGAYFSKTVIPWPLVPLYPLGDAVLTLRASAGCLAALLLGSIVALGAWRTRVVPAGWFLFLGTLVPVLGFVAVGNQAYADRYTYLPSVGLALILAWALGALWRVRVALGWAAAAAAVAAIIAATGLTRAQIARWEDTESLFRHTIAHTGDNSVAHNNLGRFLLEHGRTLEGLDETREAARLAPGNLQAQFNFGCALLINGHAQRALATLLPLAVPMGDDPALHLNLALAMYACGDTRFPIAAREALARLPEGHPGRAQIEALLP